MSRITEKEYDSLTKQVSPNSPVLSDCIRAFLIGGAVCAFAQGLLNFYLWLGMDMEPAKSLVSVTLIFITAMLTAAHLYDNYARFAGAGSLVPITGFANAVASPAVEFKSEGFVLGVGANMFKIAGPVIVYGTIASVVYGVIYWVMQII